jgi:methylmalonyl-CoA mutase C-terminal domain/subunit
MPKKIRVLIAKPGLDGHDRGARIVALALRDAGMEVIYTGLRQTPERIAEIALQENVDLVGLSILSGAHLSLSKKMIDSLNQAGIGEVPVVVGGLVLRRDVQAVKELGVAEVFPSGTPVDDIVNWIQENL